MSLVLSGVIGDSFMIDDDVKVTIVGCNNGQVRLAFDADKSIAIHRQVIYDKVQKEKEALKRVE